MTHPTDGNCIFCKIVAGQIPCFKLLEDANTIAFMDINPVNPGHALAVAKGHWPTVDVIPPEVLAEVAQTAQKVAKAAFKALGPPASICCRPTARAPGRACRICTSTSCRASRATTSSSTGSPSPATWPPSRRSTRS